MKFVRFGTDDEVLYINPDHIISVADDECNPGSCHLYTVNARYRLQCTADIAMEEIEEHEREQKKPIVSYPNSCCANH